jgi:hypothetical protein
LFDDAAAGLRASARACRRGEVKHPEATRLVSGFRVCEPVRGAIGGAASGVRTAHAAMGIGWQDGSCILMVRVNLCGYRK